MTVNATGVLTALLDYAKALGVFEVARLTEFKSAPPNGLCFALWAQQLGSAPTGSGLASTTALLQATAQIYFPAFQKPEDDAELKVIGAADGYLDRISGGFTLGGLVRNVDLLGEMGEPLRWEFGYINIDNKISRTAVLQIRAVFNDAWTQGA